MDQVLTFITIAYKKINKNELIMFKNNEKPFQTMSNSGFVEAEIFKCL